MLQKDIDFLTKNIVRDDKYNTSLISYSKHNIKYLKNLLIKYEQEILDNEDIFKLFYYNAFIIKVVSKKSNSNKLFIKYYNLFELVSNSIKLKYANYFIKYWGHTKFFKQLPKEHFLTTTLPEAIVEDCIHLFANHNLTKEEISKFIGRELIVKDLNCSYSFSKRIYNYILTLFDINDICKNVTRCYNYINRKNIPDIKNISSENIAYLYKYYTDEQILERFSINDLKKKYSLL